MTLEKTNTALLGDLRDLIEQSRDRVATAVNSELVLLYWKVGQRIRTDVLGEGRAEYGKQIVSTVAAQLSAEYGRGFNRRNLYNMLRFAELFPDEEIVHALRTQLTWTHLRELTAIDEPLKRQFYTEMCRIERWSTRTLKAKVGGMLFERTAIAKRPDAVVLETLNAPPRTSSFVIHTFSTSWAFRAIIANTSLRPPFFASWRASCWSWARALASSPGRSGCPSERTTTT